MELNTRVTLSFLINERKQAGERDQGEGEIRAREGKKMSVTGI